MCIQGKLIGKVCLENEANEEITCVYVHKIVIENLNELFYIYIYTRSPSISRITWNSNE